MNAKMPKGFSCTTCDKWHEFGFYVAAHWTLPLTHTCDVCGAKHRVLEGKAKLVKRGKKSTADTGEKHG